jgi:HTH-type transcriptional regulator / antitoxin HigA
MGTHAEYDRIDASTIGGSMIAPITDSKSHTKALARIQSLWNAAPGSEDERELDALATLVDAYEKRTFPIHPPDPVA